ncbi:hypothetical protein CQA20_29320, partial [Klebsiella pneumoniae]
LRLAQQKRTGYLVEQWPDGTSYLVGYGATIGRGMYPGLGWTVLVRRACRARRSPPRALRLAQQKRTGYLVEQWPDGTSYLVGYGATIGRG